MKRLGLVLVLIMAGATLFASDYLGTYSLSMPLSKGWQYNFIRIEKMEKGKVRGKIGIDLSLGYEGRGPLDYERLHEIPFEARLIKGGNRFKFRVTIADFRKYTFILGFKQQKNTYLTGKVMITDLKTKEVYQSEVKGSKKITE